MLNPIAVLWQSSKTILTNRDIALLWRESNPDRLKSKIAWQVKQGHLTRLTRGVFAKDQNYDPRELAASLYTPSYISFETVLREAGAIFQHYEAIFAAGPWSKKITIDTHTFVFRTFKDSILYNPFGITHEKNYSIAAPERALLDTLYLFPDYYFDNLRSINWERCFEMVGLYHNRQLVKRLNHYHKTYAQ